LNLILDSHVLVWWLSSQPRLEPFRDVIASAAAVGVSLATPWELWIKQRTGRLNLPEDLPEQLRDNDIDLLIPTLDELRLSARLPRLHGDPFDRLIVAQALTRRAPLMTADRALAGYGIDIIAV
jgi:PIN domain nuclease of toxin-antitoxin system